MKIVMIMGIAGGCRREDLVKMTIGDIEDRGAVVVVNVLNTRKNGTRHFVITDQSDRELEFLGIFRKYVGLRPKDSKCNRFFLGFRNGKCSNQPVGINSLGAVPWKIAKYLNLQDPASFTGHAFRRTSAIISTDKSDIGLIMENSPHRRKLSKQTVNSYYYVYK